MNNFTPAQIERISTMNADDAKCWTAWYAEQNEKALAEQAAAEGAILAKVRETGEAEPTEVRRAVGVPVATFNDAVRMLKRLGSLGIDEAGLMVAW